MLFSEDISSVLLRERLELLAYIGTFTGDAAAAQAVYQEICAQALWREEGFESAAHLLESTRRAARQRASERPGKRPALREATLNALEAEWAGRQGEGTSAESLVALDQCLQAVAPAHFERLEIRSREDAPVAVQAPGYALLARLYRTLAVCVRGKLSGEAA